MVGMKRNRHGTIVVSRMEEEAEEFLALFPEGKDALVVYSERNDCTRIPEDLTEIESLLSAFPVECWEMIFGFLGTKEKVRLSSACKFFNCALQDFLEGLREERRRKYTAKAMFRFLTQTSYEFKEITIKNDNKELLSFVPLGRCGRYVRKFSAVYPAESSTLEQVGEDFCEIAAMNPDALVCAGIGLFETKWEFRRRNAHHEEMPNVPATLNNFFEAFVEDCIQKPDILTSDLKYSIAGFLSGGCIRKRHHKKSATFFSIVKQEAERRAKEMPKTKRPLKMHKPTKRA